MSRRFRLSVLVLVLLAPPALAGCEPLHRQGVRKGESPLAVQAGSDDPSFEKPDELQGFFKARGNGAWSSEARDIERSLGAY